MSIAGSIIGSASDSWFRDTKLGVWFYAKVDQLYTWAANRYGLKLITDDVTVCAVRAALNEVKKWHTGPDSGKKQK